MLPTRSVSWLTSAEIKVDMRETGLALRLKRTAMAGDTDT